MIDAIEIDTDEDGFHLFIDGDLTDEIENYLSGRVETRLNLRLPQDAALALLREVDEKIRPWAQEAESVAAERRMAIRHGRSPLLGEGPPFDIIDGEIEEEDEGAAALEAAYDRADRDRKREREDR